MFRFLPYIVKCLWRHRGRTVLTVVGSAVAIFVFCFVTAVKEGLDRLTSQQQAERALIVFQANRFCPSTSRLPEDYALAIRKLPGVTDVFPIKVFTNNCRASLDVVVFHGIPPGQLRKARELTMVSGDWESFERGQDAALVGQAVAHRRRLAVGDTFSIGAVSVKVAGIFTAEQPAEENFLYTHLDFLQRIRGMNSVGTVTQFEVRLADDADAEAVAAAIDARFRGGPIATDTRTKGAFQADTVADLAELIGFAKYLGYACVALVFAIVTTTTVMAVQDRIREHAVLRTLGVSDARLFGLVVSESLLVSLLGGLIGVAASLSVLAWGSLAIGTEGVTIAFVPSLRLALAGMTSAVAVGVVAGAIPGWQAAVSDIVPALRQA